MTLTATFGSGGAEPYAYALQGRGEVLYLRNARSQALAPVTMDVTRWSSDADTTDLSLLMSVDGPVIDIGCGPGRMVRAAQQLGLEALGLDVSEAAVELARTLGGSFLQGSIFDSVPDVGTWQTALLVDGNIGIGGDVRRLLARCAALLRPGGEIVVEVDSRPDHTARYLGEVVDSRGAASASFPWAEIGRQPLLALLPDLGLREVQRWEIDARSFCRLAKTK